MQQIPPFYVGQELQVKVGHPKGYFLKGDKVLVERIMECDGDPAIQVSRIHCMDKCDKCGMYTFYAHFPLYYFEAIDIDAEFEEVKLLLP